MSKLLSIPYGSDKTTSLNPPVNLLPFFLSHMVQIKPSLSWGFINLLQNFLSHMVQIKLHSTSLAVFARELSIPYGSDKTAFSGFSLISFKIFLSHMVQIKQEIENKRGLTILQLSIPYGSDKTYSYLKRTVPPQ